MKHEHNDFPSDVFLSLVTAGTKAEVLDHNGVTEVIPLGDLPTFNMTRKVLVRFLINLEEQKKKNNNRSGINSLWLSGTNGAKASGEWKFRSYKIMPRSSNAHAYVNAGFMALIDKSDGFKILSKPTI